MASGDKPINAVLADPSSVQQGSNLFPQHPSGSFPAQGQLVLEGFVSGLVVQATLKLSAANEAGVPDFDVEKQYKLTIEEV